MRAGPRSVAPGHLGACPRTGVLACVHADRRFLSSSGRRWVAGSGFRPATAGFWPGSGRVGDRCGAPAARARSHPRRALLRCGARVQPPRWFSEPRGACTASGPSPVGPHPLQGPLAHPEILASAHLPPFPSINTPPPRGQVPGLPQRPAFLASGPQLRGGGLRRPGRG